MTKKTIWTAASSMVVGFATVVIAAQSAPAPQSNAASSDKQITVTGCLTQAPAESAGAAATTGSGTAATAGTSGTTAGAATDAGASAPQFILTNATASEASDSSASDTSGAAAPSAPAASGGQTYRLIANPSALSPHVGKKIAVTGTLENQPSAGAAPSSAASAANAPALRAKSAKILAASCSQ